MAERNVELTRRRVLGGLVTVGAAGAAAGAGTVSYFSDSESSSGNTIQAGTLDLTFESGGSFAFSTSMTPGQTTSDSVTLVNDESITGSVDVSVSYSESDGAANSANVTADEFASALDVTITYGGSPVSIGGRNTVTLKSLADTDVDGSDDITDLADPGSGTDFAVEIQFDSAVKNKYQSDGVDITFTFDLNQQDSQ